MEFLLLFTERKGDPSEPSGFAQMNQYARELAARGRLRRGAPLAPDDDAALVRVRGGTAVVSDGPFPESKEVIGGFWVVEARSREEALEIARESPHARYGTVEVHALRSRHTYIDSGKDTPFLLAFHREPGLADPDGAKYREMIEFGHGLERDGKLLETAPLANDPPPARVQVRGGKALVTDGPFAEAKEGVGGYSLVRVAGRAEAVALAERYPHARWGPVEVREILFFDEI
ncbi:MAG TPA: YciI family protein [Myxococcota bacterium]|nr:YciI family protein [Myxococcota bacterium]